MKIFSYLSAGEVFWDIKKRERGKKKSKRKRGNTGILFSGVIYMLYLFYMVIC